MKRIIDSKNQRDKTFNYDNDKIFDRSELLQHMQKEINDNDSIQFNFIDGPSKVHVYNEAKVTDSVSFSGSSFSEEKFNSILNIKINGKDNASSEFNFSIDINKPPSEDLFYLWGGMTVFWVSIVAYVLYISSKFTQLRER